MTTEIEDLRAEFKTLKKSLAKEIDSQRVKIQKLENEIKSLQTLRSDLTRYVNNLMRKADNVIKQNYASLRRTQVIDRQKIEELNQEIGRLSRLLK